MYTNKNRPANNIHDLIRYLKSEEKGNKFVYRGQVEEYQSPLIPSRYRKYISYSDSEISRDNPEYENSAKKIGVKYYGDYVANFEKSFNDIIVDVKNRDVILNIYKKALCSPLLLFRQQANRVAFNYFESRVDLIRSILSREEFHIFDLYKDRWIPLIDNYDRRNIRNFGFYKPFNYLLGTALAQQYGFSSDGLDATKDINVACFFATRSFGDDYNSVQDEGTGIIYRFPYEDVFSFGDSDRDYDYYSKPSLIDIDNLFENLLYDSGDIEGFFNSFKLFFSNKMTGKTCTIDNLRFPINTYKKSRIYQQHAVIILPDEIREDDEKSELSVIGTKLPKYQYIEDMAVRKGVEKYYFRHSGINKIELNRESLWPREDSILFLIVWIITSICQRTFSRENHMIMHRLDLIDGGYNSGEFLHTCMNIALEHLAIASKNKNILLY